MERKLRTYNAEEKAYRAAMKRARVNGDTSLSVIIEGFITAYGLYGISETEINYYVSYLPFKKKKAK